MKTNKTTLSFTDEELTLLYSALNTYSVKMMSESKTWANYLEKVKIGQEDVWHDEAIAAICLQDRVHQASERLKARRA